MLDNSLRRLQNENNLTAENVAIRILCSPWARRLWTLQEAGLLMRAYFLIGNTRMQSYPDLRLSAKNHPNLASIYAGIPEEHPLHRLIAATCDRNLKIATYTGGFFKGFRDDRFIDNALNSTWSRLEAWFMTMYMDWGTASIQGRVPVFTGIAYRYAKLPEMLSDHFTDGICRTLSKVSDEAIVSAAMFDKGSASPGKIAQTKPDERYRILFQNLGYIPWRMIFLNQKRYEEYGSRWIPRSLLSQNSPSLKSIKNFQGPEDENPPLWPKQATKEGLGCMPLAMSIQDKLVLDPNGWFRVKLYEAWYRAFAHSAGSSEPLSPIPSGDLVLLFDRDLVAEAPKQLTAVLATVISRAKPVEQIEEEESVAPDEKRSTWQSLRVIAKRAGTVMTSCKSRFEGLIEFDQLSREDEDSDIPELRIVPDQTTAVPGSSLAWRVG